MKIASLLVLSVKIEDECFTKEEITRMSICELKELLSHIDDFTTMNRIARWYDNHIIDSYVCELERSCNLRNY